MRNKSPNNINLDYTLVGIIVLLGVISLFTLYTITPFLPSKYDGSHFVLKQAIWYVIGGGFVGLIMLIDYDRFKQLTWYLYGFVMFLLLMLFFRFPSPIIIEANGAVSWIKFPFLGTLQPSEIMKVALVLTIAHVIDHHHHKYLHQTVKTDLWLIFKILAVALPPMGLVAVEPDLGGFLVLSAITGAMILISGIQWRIILPVIFTAIAAVGGIVGAYYLVPDKLTAFFEQSVFQHVASRFYGWLNPEKYLDSGYQLILAMQAIGSGQLFGKGISHLEVNVPERQTDMIFTAISEQFGFIGASIVIALFFLMIYRLIYIALQSNDQYGSYLLTGLIGMFSYQIFQNIGMSIQLLPITGLPLPFLSYGGSSTLTYLIAIGIALNIYSRTKKYMF
ncbi:FtsW/RodA/SpoVE family cell cycle protein [Virgibacillus sp. 179-BFC.A HS]|uniref:FtsW/RodA/SpoVE family cell cycle protein n=1 Tax=Tigheibacillus jepli TaxID=3035914 RepID=A0ABU5CIL0_9BACI|nr:FtsW/RodA/SpoVE family cell cycle protein [Virgibacillus sp. 179-BFC.A HS]MDY0406164.1 FtsW/RodA/SpoVE family cell cycle protein [Virgibacillus sp. 179-BFC.A HS]